jgi:hypothetical protein
VVPGVAYGPYPRIAKEVGKAGDGRQRSHDNPSTESPHPHQRPELVVRCPKDYVAGESGDEKGNREWDEHRMQRMTRQLGGCGDTPQIKVRHWEPPLGSKGNVALERSVPQPLFLS